MAISVFFYFSGCTIVDRMHSSNKFEEHHYDAEAITLERANNAFQNRSYQKALEIYRMLSQLAQDENIRRKALYGLACTRLILAESPEELSESITLWDVWRQLESAETKDDYPFMLRPLLLKKTLPEKLKKRSEQNEIKMEADKSLRKALSEKDKKIESLQNRLKEMESENKKLKHQLSTLETIDKDMQKKKTEIEKKEIQ